MVNYYVKILFKIGKINHTTLFVTKVEDFFQAELLRELLFKVGEPAALFLIALILYLTESPKRESAGLLLLMLPFFGGDGIGLVDIA